MLMRAAEDPELKESVGRDVEEILDATKRIEEIIERLHNVTDFVTRPYVGDSEILDVKKSTRIIPRRSAGGENSGTR
jgi:hypothetical protein